ncbi:hypothetical protein H0O00_03770 [Candidatus Micrarchaeota archaeon]|nr:hypothetical protein [Candidatus Micrarchaeota archaeon]
MKSRCRIEVHFPDRESLDAAAAALSHEADVGGRSTTKMIGKDKTLALEIEAQDVVALRAAANACLRALQVFENVDKVSQNFDRRGKSDLPRNDKEVQEDEEGK